MSDPATMGIAGQPQSLESFQTPDWTTMKDEDLFGYARRAYLNNNAAGAYPAMKALMGRPTAKGNKVWGEWMAAISNALGGLGSS